MSYDKVLQELMQFKNDVIDGRYPQPTALGPGKLSKNTIKAKTITGNMIDVSDLHAVNSNTGALTVSGALTIGTSGSLQSGKTAYSDTSNAGFWMGIESAVTKVRVGNSGHTKGFTWDGTDLVILGSIIAKTGSIGGWIIGDTDLTSDTGATGIASSGSYRLWVGNSTPASAVFSVTSAGLLTTKSGVIGGWNIDTTGIRLGSGATARGMDSGSTAFYAGSDTPSTAPFHVSTSGILSAAGAAISGASTFSGSLSGATGTFSGGVTASSLSITGTASFSGGTMTLPNGGSITSSNVDLNQGTISGMTVDGALTVNGTTTIQSASGGKLILNSAGTFGDVIKFQNSGTDKASIYASSTYAYFEYTSGGSLFISSSGTTMATPGLTGIIAVTTTYGIELVSPATKSISVVLGDSAGTNQLIIKDSGGTQVFGINSDGELVRPIANDSTAEGTYYGRIPIYINGSLKYISIRNS